MGRVVKSVDSRKDYSEIWDYIAADNIAAADRLIERFDRAAEDLAMFPGFGRPREEYQPGLRSLPVKNYTIFYRRIEGGIELVRVVHGARDMDRVFGRE